MKRPIFHFVGRQGLVVKNPFRFSRTVVAPQFSYRIVALICVVLSGLLYWLFFTPAFAIERIKIESAIALPHETLTRIVQDQLQSRRWGALSQRNLLAFDGSALKRNISQQFVIESVKIKKDRPHLVTIAIAERPRDALWSSRGKFYALDAQGVILDEVANGKTQVAPIVYDKSGGVPKPKDRVLTPEIMAFINALLQNERIQALHPQFLMVEGPNVSDIALKIQEGWRIYFDTAAPLAAQLQNLELTLRNTIAPEARSKLEYIDLRFGERVYVKYR